MREANVRFPEKLRLRTPRGLSAALEQAAGRNHTSPSEWARQTLLRGLAAEGVSLRDGTVTPSAQPLGERS
jgi:hypothetical protein